MFERLLRALQTRTGPLWLAALGFGLSLPALGLGFVADDRVHAFVVTQRPLETSLFRLTPEDAAADRFNGWLAWWSSPNLSVDFFRPLSSWTHRLEYRLWPDAAWAMHLTNVVLYALLVLVAARLYREFMPGEGRSAALAGLLFAIDEGHAASAGWISGRNTVLASLFALTALLLHVRSRAGGSRALLHAASAACVALALLCAEAGIAALAYLIAYALVFEPAGAGHWRRRLLSLAPQLGVIAIWAIWYLHGGYGARGTSFYRDLAHPGFVLREGLLDLPVWLFGMFGPGMISAAIAQPAAPVRALALLLVSPLLAAMVLGTPRTRLNLFFALGALGSLPTLFATQPQERLLLCASLGSCGLVASFIAAAAGHAQRFLRVSGMTMIAFHLVLAPFLFLASLPQARPFENGTRAILAALPATLPTQVILVNTPVELLSMYTWAMLHYAHPNGIPLQSVHQLYSGNSDLLVKRIDPNTLEVRPRNGWGALPVERIFGALYDLPRAGSELDCESIHVSVQENDAEGHPTRVQFRFPTPLESTDRLWLSWRGKKPVPWHPPPLGRELVIPGLNLLSALEP